MARLLLLCQLLPLVCLGFRLAQRREKASAHDDVAFVCSGNGRLKSALDWTCICDAGWTGSDCADRAAPPQQVNATCYSPGGSDGVATCAWYSDCLTERFPGCTGHALEYAQSYGGEYCQRFTDNSDKFSAGGKVWVDKVKLCLQEELARDVLRQEVEVADCEEIRRVAFDSHPKCYVEPVEGDTSVGLCVLVQNSPGDVVKILEVTWDALFSRESVKQILDSAKLCLEFWADAIRRGLRDDGYDEVADMV